MQKIFLMRLDLIAEVKIGGGVTVGTIDSVHGKLWQNNFFLYKSQLNKWEKNISSHFHHFPLKIFATKHHLF